MAALATLKNGRVHTKSDDWRVLGCTIAQGGTDVLMSKKAVLAPLATLYKQHRCSHEIRRLACVKFTFNTRYSSTTIGRKTILAARAITKHENCGVLSCTIVQVLIAVEDNYLGPPLQRFTNSTDVDTKLDD